MKRIILSLALLASISLPIFGQEHHEQPVVGNEPTVTEEKHEGHDTHEAEGYDPTPGVMHHIADANEYHILGEWSVPLPCILYDTEHGVKFMMSSAFHHGAKAVDGFALVHGSVMKIVGFPVLNGEAELEEVPAHDAHEDGKNYVGVNHISAEAGETHYVVYEGIQYELEKASALTAFTTWYDFSITKNVLAMLVATLLMFVVFRSIAKRYANNPDKAPSGIQGLIEPIIVFLRDEVIKPGIGPRYEKYMPFVLSLFFFILFNNLFGLIPLPIPAFGSNVTGSVSVTMGLALFTFLVVNFSANKAYWGHIFWFPDVPVFVKIMLLPIELLGIFIRPFTLMIRLFANITAGHIVILSLVSLIFVFGNAGQSVGGSAAGAGLAIPFVFMMNVLELFVAFLQAFIFSLLTSLYIGSAIEEHHHHEGAHDHDHEHAHALAHKEAAAH